jgi:hypothetical protein
MGIELDLGVELSSIDLGDKRLNRRIREVAIAFGTNPSASLPKVI